MRLPKKHRFLLALPAIGALVLAAYFFVPAEQGFESQGVATPQASAGSQSGDQKKSPPSSTGAATRTVPQPPAAAPLDSTAAQQLAPLMSSPLPLRDGGLRRDFQLSTTEVAIRQSDGIKRTISLPRADSPAAFAASLEKLRSTHGSEPELVLYPVGFPQDESTRRIATREVVITAPSRSEADALAAANGLVFKKAPAFAPNAFVYEAPTSTKALSVVSLDSYTPQTTKTLLLARKGVRLSVPNDPYFQLQWHLKFQNQLGALPGTDINVESVWNYPDTFESNFIRGKGVTIGIVDDGLEWSHPDLISNIKTELQWDWNQRDNDPKPYYISDAHGTAVAGVSAARGNNRIGVTGVAPESGIAGMRLIADEWSDLDEAEVMVWKANEIHIRNNSWHHPTVAGPGYWLPSVKLGLLTDAALKDAANFGREGKGSIITFAAGNSAQQGSRPDYKALQSSIYTIAVGAVSSWGVKSDYSEEGACIVVSAPSNTVLNPGLGIMTTDNKGSYGYNPGFLLGDFPSSGDVSKNFGGTSSACPAVSGVIALMLDKNPNLGWRDVQEILMRSAVQIDSADTDWKTPVAPDFLNHNHKYGAGLVDAATAVALSGNWTNLTAQTSASVSTNTTTAIDASGGQNATITRTFTVPASLRTEHVTLALSIPGIFKGDLQINLTSPAGTNSVFCLPHGDTANGVDANGNPIGYMDLNTNGSYDQGEPYWTPNQFDNWTFMTVRNWGENSSGNWTLTITNSGNAIGNLTASNLTVFGTQTPALSNPLPVVALKTSRATAFLGTTVTLNATAMDKNSNGTAGSIAKVEFFSNNGSGPVSIGNSTSTSGNNSYSVPWSPPAAGTYTLTATATDGATPSASATSAPVTLRVDKYPVAAWDFDTPAQSVVPLATAIQASRQYSANFGSNNGTIAKILFDGTLGSSSWSVPNGEIWTGPGNQTLNFLADANPFGTNTALLLRGGRNLSSNNKSIVFQLDMTKARRLEISYATMGDAGGFTTHTWEYWNELKGPAGDWEPIFDDNGNASVSVPPAYTVITLDQVAGAGFNGRTGARVRLKVFGATAINGTNLLDNIRFNATVAP